MEASFRRAPLAEISVTLLPTIVLAVLAAAVVVSVAIVYVARPPDECAEWNDRFRVAVDKLAVHVDEQIMQTGSPATKDIHQIPAEHFEVFSERPEGCDVDQETADILDEIGI